MDAHAGSKHLLRRWRSLLLTTVLLVGLGAEAGSLAKWPVSLQSQVVKLSREFDGEFAFYVKDLKSGGAYTYNSATPFYLASVIKMPVLLTVYRQYDRGELKPSDPILFEADDLRDGAGTVSGSKPGTEFTVDSL